MLPAWIIFSALGGLFSNGNYYTTRTALKKGDDAVVFGWYFEAIRFLVTGIWALFNFHLVFSPQAFVILFLMGSCEACAMYMYVKMHSFTELSISTIVSRLRLVWIPIIAFILLREQLSLFQYAAIAVLFFGVSIVVSPKKIVIDKSLRFSLLFSLFSAGSAVFIKMATSYASMPVIMMAFSLPTIILFPLLMKDSRKRFVGALNKRISYKFLAVFLDLFAFSFYLLAVRSGPVSTVSAVYQSTMIVGVLAGIIFLHERDLIIRKLLGSFITILGIFLLSR